MRSEFFNKKIVIGMVHLLPMPGNAAYRDNKEEIIRISRRISTFETSILPYEDCCTVFTPRHPKLKPTIAECEAAEANLDVEGLVKAAVDGIERVFIEMEI